ncbi:hypothetical protein GKC30_11660 [Pseudodesulfovibrio sp. F-1]|uniref:Putative zinc-ribbon domain-containing protein n=1 Tax=Pseudodesulfovibrio alkaliphilus TaxID=2661613 RepID=A0A7K1KR12_9BACT|nr:zinc ribbon domain-containing protein [Pseudodesulfovibrio alkaliphilus]MUM78291.1 hypothetical protein [Pseudodesulfovibrio alkaliphilus]
MLIAFWIIMAIIVAMIANSKGKGAIAWFFYGLIIWPIALVHILITKDDFQNTTSEIKTNECNSKYVCMKCGKVKEEEGWCSTCCDLTYNRIQTSQKEKECPYCAELIKAKAIKCKHCGSEIEPNTI